MKPFLKLNKMKETNKELEAVRVINQILLKKVDRLYNELEMEKEFHSRTLSEWREARDTIEAREADIVVMELILGVEPLNKKKPF